MSEHGPQDERARRLLEQVAALERQLRRTAHLLVAKQTSPHSFQGTDLVSHTALELIRRRDSLPSEPWLVKRAFGAAMKRALQDSVRRRRRRGDVLGTLARDVQLSETQDSGVALDLQQALERLREVDEGVTNLLEMVVICGMTHAEAATELGVSERTIRKRLRAARKLLDRQLEFDSQRDE